MSGLRDDVILAGMVGGGMLVAAVAWALFFKLMEIMFA